MEAMAMELPIVSSFSGAIPELIEDGVSGLLVPPNDEKALAAAIARLLDDVDLCRAFGAAARRRVEERFDITRNAARYAELFGLAKAKS
jgi:glycosyltransferase involved in cell wall biosynthesis